VRRQPQLAQLAVPDLFDILVHVGILGVCAIAGFDACELVLAVFKRAAPDCGVFPNQVPWR
jgi:hypothetical protein